MVAHAANLFRLTLASLPLVTLLSELPSGKVPPWASGAASALLAQNHPASVQSVDQVADLLKAVRNVAALDSALHEGRQALFFALPTRNGNLTEAVKKVATAGAADRAVQALLKLMASAERSEQSGDRVLLANAAFVLGKLGGPARPAVPVLTRLTANADLFVAGEARQALSLIAP